MHEKLCHFEQDTANAIKIHMPTVLISLVLSGPLCLWLMVHRNNGSQDMLNSIFDILHFLLGVPLDVSGSGDGTSGL